MPPSKKTWQLRRVQEYCKQRKDLLRPQIQATTLRQIPRHLPIQKSQIDFRGLNRPTRQFPSCLLEEDNILLLNLCNSLPIQLLLLRILKRQRMQIQPMRYFRFYRGCRKKIPVGTLRQLTALIHILTFRRIQVPELRRRFQGSPHCYSYLYTMRHLPILKPWPHSEIPPTMYDSEPDK